MKKNRDVNQDVECDLRRGTFGSTFTVGEMVKDLFFLVCRDKSKLNYVLKRLTKSSVFFPHDVSLLLSEGIERTK